MHRTTLRSLATASLALTLAGLLASCSDDDDAAAREVAVPAAACDAAVDLGAAFGAAPEDPAEFAGWADETLVPIGAAFSAAFDGDDPTADAATTLTDAFAEIAESGDPSVLESEDAAAAQAEVGKRIHEDCALESVDVTAVEYAYQGAPTELDAGRVSFAMRNDGVEEHEMVLFRLNDGVEASSFDELMAEGEDAMANLTFTGVAFGGPDTTSYTAVDLEPGTYFLVCFIPVGGGEDGPPHFMEGMHQTITVA